MKSNILDLWVGSRTCCLKNKQSDNEIKGIA